MDGGSTRVVIVGGGAAGALVAISLLRLGRPDLEVVVIEPRPDLARGVAYGTTDPWHRLNVPAIAMSALPDDPDHFRRWADIPREAFARRVDYGRYIQQTLHDTAAASASAFRHVSAVAARIDRGDAGALEIVLTDHEAIRADAVVLATGVETPLRPGYLEVLDGDPRVLDNPWIPGALDVVGEGETVAIIGSSLTAIDLAGTISQHPFARPCAGPLAPRRVSASPRGPVAGSPARACLHGRGVPCLRRSTGRRGGPPPELRR